MSETPRTDEQAGFDENHAWVRTIFARELERENARLRSELEAAKSLFLEFIDDEENRPAPVHSFLGRIRVWLAQRREGEKE